VAMRAMGWDVGVDVGEAVVGMGSMGFAALHPSYG
jgi:hypothetical protein